MSGPLPHPPFHDIPGLSNFRELQGTAAMGQPDTYIRPGVVFRSSEPSQLTDDGVTKLQALGITHVYDLRSVVEIQRAATSPGRVGEVKAWPGATRVFLPVFLDQDYSPEAVALRFSNYAGEGCDVSRLCSPLRNQEGFRLRETPPQRVVSSPYRVTRAVSNQGDTKKTNRGS
jgi:Tyrosine phosphatase family